MICNEYYSEKYDESDDDFSVSHFETEAGGILFLYPLFV